jgi:DNA repair exonuclease SbcCD ATPase subunit
LNKTNYTQIISINQASGFQNFVISMCLRLSLFGNNICNQLFIDEGFTACDKDNLSIVPNFLKNLLLIFNTITIVSHIDIIQDNIDDKIDIKYNKNTKSSNINFGDRIY